MRIACRRTCQRAFLLLSGFLVTSAVLAAGGGHPNGFWILENTDPDIPFGGLKLNMHNRFELLIYDSECALYVVEGSIKQKSAYSWELKNSVDYSNTFLMIREGEKLKLVDTEDQKMFFFKTTQSKLDKAIKQRCKKSDRDN